MPTIFDHWPSGARDTTEFPKVNISIDAVLREHLNAFIKMDGIGWTDYDAMNVASGAEMTGSRLRTYRKMYEKFGLIYHEEGKVKLSRLGHQMATLEKNLCEKKDTVLEQLRVTAIDILSRYQLKNPMDADPLPSDCDVLPSICIWKAMRKLDNKLHPEEVNRVILRVMKMEELDGAIEKIKAARALLDGDYSAQSEAVLQENLGRPVHIEQIQARIAPWFSFVGWGGLIIEQTADNEGYRNLIKESLSIIDKILENQPVYYEAKDEADWIAHYIGDPVEYVECCLDVEEMPRVTGGTNILYYGVPGSGKSYAINKICSDETYMERVVFHPDYSYSDFVGQILPRLVKEEGKEEKKLTYEFVEGPFTNVLSKAINDPGHMYYLIIEEINRGNAPAIFGEIFQLLDRKETGKVGESEYSIVNYDIANHVYGDTNKRIRIPSNMTLLATMNTSDQNVFTLDTAFQRRWDMRHIPNKFTDEHAHDIIDGTRISWGVFAGVVNDLVIEINADMVGSGDKRLGAYFAKTSELTKTVFPQKVLKYLWDDAFRMDKQVVFDKRHTSLDEVLETYQTTSEDSLKSVLKGDVYQKMVDGMKNEGTSDGAASSAEEETREEV